MGAMAVGDGCFAGSRTGSTASAKEWRRTCEDRCRSDFCMPEDGRTGVRSRFQIGGVKDESGASGGRLNGSLRKVAADECVKRNLGLLAL
ncbi:hypothetical protein L2E82_35836 [Cichorium intybus]|uniref:Uncharacterized protein n=1 Tax=Cichorium intybus TaxID=13427 RepID=A0ACB9BPW6_CICIN|nr:hypothetical protein L2E82_35836 [Cichorium intybus]